MPSVWKVKDSNQRCCGCHNRIEHGSYRIEVTRSAYMRSVYHNYHIECYGVSDNTLPPHQLCHLISVPRFNELDQKSRTEMLRFVYPKVVAPEQRPNLPLSKPISEMKMKELKAELQKRDLRRIGKKQELADRLRHYMNTEAESARKMQSENLAVGYCRRMEGTKHKMNIPIYLKMIVVDYFGLGFKY